MIYVLLYDMLIEVGRGLFRSKSDVATEVLRTIIIESEVTEPRTIAQVIGPVGLCCLAVHCRLLLSYEYTLLHFSQGVFIRIRTHANWTAITRCSMKRLRLENTTSFLGRRERLIVHH